MFKRLPYLVLLAILLTGSSYAQTILWEEDFEGEVDGSTTGTAAGTIGGTWSVTTIPSNGSGTFSKQDVPIVGNAFQANGTGNEGVFQTNVIDISAYGYAVIDVTLATGGGGFSATDYIRVYYKVNGGPEILFAAMEPFVVNVGFEGSAIVAGNTLQIVVRGQDNSTFCCGLGGRIVFDDLTVTGITRLFSRKSGDWDDVTMGNSTWSTISHTGASCSCTPNDNTVAIVGSSHIVNMNVDGTSGGVEVNSGSIRYTAANVDLNISRGYLLVPSGGVINRNAQASARINFTDDVISTVTVGGTINIEDITVTAGATISPGGTATGNITISDDLIISGSDASFTIAFPGTFTLTDRLEISGTGSSVTNSKTLSFASIYFNGDNNTITNNSSITLSGDITVNDQDDDDNVITNSSGATLSFVGINPNNGDFDVFNSGTISQSGNFSNINATDTNLDNLNGGTWNWSFVPGTLDADLATVLNCATASNTFNYNGAGNQTIVAITYHNLRMSVSGNRTPTADLDVNGNLLIQTTTVLVGGAFAMDVEGDITITNTAVLGGTGNITIGGNWSAVNAASFTEGTRTVTFDGSNQTITNAAGTETFGALTLAGSNTKSSSHTIDINGALTISGTAQFDVNANITVGGNWTVTSTNTNPFEEGTYKVTFDGTAQAISTTTPVGDNSFYDIEFSTSGNKSLSSSIVVANNLTIGASTFLSPGANTITLGGNFTNSSTSNTNNSFVEGTSTVVLNGSGNQTISTVLAAGETFNNLTLNKASGEVYLATSPSTDVNVAGTMTFTSGIFNTTTNESLTFNSGSSVSGGNNASFVDGPVSKLGNTAFTFPTGNGTRWARIGTGANSGNATTMFTAQYFASAPSITAVTAPLVRVSSEEYWTLSRSGAAASANVALFWEDGTFSGINAVNTTDLRVARLNGAAWEDAGATAVSGNTTAGSVTSASVNSGNFTSFTFGSPTALPTNPLPVELLDFTAQLNNDKVELEWSTASERNNDSFTIQRGVNAESFEDIKQVRGNGTTHVLNRYSAIDDSPIYGRSYYRLKQTDYDGKFSYSKIQVINYEGPQIPVLSVYPNPTSSNKVTITIKGINEPGQIPILIYDQRGQRVFETVVTQEYAGTMKADVIFNTQVAPGLYIIKAGRTLLLTEKFVVH
jgi:hypothetical protein